VIHTVTLRVAHVTVSSWVDNSLIRIIMNVAWRKSPADNPLHNSEKTFISDKFRRV